MKKYTVEMLKEENSFFDREYGTTESDVNKVNKIIEFIENSRTKEQIQVGTWFSTQMNTGNIIHVR